ncbi:MAG: hypothetical protein M3Q05_07170 [Bacteroidota bacterium]|nr:hypothetical protein [Bacteroidota bacterium]
MYRKKIFDKNKIQKIRLKSRVLAELFLGLGLVLAIAGLVLNFSELEAYLYSKKLFMNLVLWRF